MVKRKMDLLGKVTQSVYTKKKKLKQPILDLLYQLSILFIFYMWQNNTEGKQTQQKHVVIFHDYTINVQFYRPIFGSILHSYVPHNTGIKNTSKLVALCRLALQCAMLIIVWTIENEAYYISQAFTFAC